ncbi:ABC transporter ATP-binding protein [Brevibacillus sp. H7]|uniref:ABC transporter ATP-binding protein n=1 Tax=Brevibacillus sp. H7 TaxID=3349138 RepID=UPI0037FFC19F
MSVLNVEGVTMQFGGLQALSQVDVSIARGEIRAIIGPNGSGKTTFFNVVTGVYRPTFGKILLQGEDVTGLAPHHIHAKGIARTFQNIRLFKDLTVLENVLIAMNRQAAMPLFHILFRTPTFRRREGQVREAALHSLEQLGILQHAEDLAGSLPYGKQRLLEIARAIASQPQLLILDEPTAGMNDSESEELKQRIFALRDKGLTIVLVEHDMRFVMSLSDRITVLDSGRKIAEGKPGEIQRDPAVIKAYLGGEADVEDSKLSRSV